MTTSILRTADAWWVQTATGAAKIATTATTTGELLADRAAIDAAAHSTDTVPVDSLELLSPVTTPCRVVAQMTNYASHVKDAGMDPEVDPVDVLPQVVRVDQRARSTTSSSPAHVKFLDYEVEIGLVIGTRHPRRHHRSPKQDLSDYIAGLVVTNDVSARDIQLPQTQFYEAKSYPTFTPVGPALVLLDADELKRFGDLRLQLRVNGEVRQNMVVERRHDLPAAAGAAGADPLPAPRRRRSGDDRHPRRHRAERTAEADRDHRQPAAARGQVEGVLQAAGQATRSTSSTAMSSNSASRPTTAPSIWAPSAPP